MALIQALVGKAIGAFGKKPEIPVLPAVNASESQANTIKGNLQNLPEAQRLASAVNAGNRAEAMKSFRAAVPGGEQILATGTQTIADMLRGQLPQDVQRQIQQNAAEAGVAGGFGGTGAGRALGARDLGLASLSLVEKGLSSAQQWMAGAVRLTQPQGYFDVSSMMFTPQQRLGFDVNERNQQYGRNLMEAQVKAAPDPGNAAIIEAWTQDEAQIMELAGQALSAVGKGAGAMCWVARSAFGSGDPRWLLFRSWLGNRAPGWFFNLYRKHGEKFALWLDEHPRVKPLIRFLMAPVVQAEADRLNQLPPYGTR